MDSSELRKRVQEERTFADAVEAFFRLVNQSDLTWQDLLDGLDHRGLIAETAAIRLYQALGVLVPESGFVTERQYWEKALEARGLVAESPVAIRSPSNSRG